MGQPPRHGAAWDRVGPTPVEYQDEAPLRRSTTAPPVPGKPPATGRQTIPIPLPISLPKEFPTITVRTLNTFFQVLPTKTLQFFVETGQARITASNLIVGGTIPIIGVQVPDKTTWIVTGAQFYGLAPSSQLEAPMVNITAEQLVGLIRFELKLGDHEPMQTHGVFVDPLAAYSTGTTSNSGLPFSESPLARNTTFALYARSGQSVKVNAQVDTVPRFWLSTIVARLSGFMMPELSFDTIVSRINEGLF